MNDGDDEIFVSPTIEVAVETSSRSSSTSSPYDELLEEPLTASSLEDIVDDGNASSTTTTTSMDTTNDKASSSSSDSGKDETELTTTTTTTATMRTMTKRPQFPGPDAASVVHASEFRPDSVAPAWLHMAPDAIFDQFDPIEGQVDYRGRGGRALAAGTRTPRGGYRQPGPQRRRRHHRFF